jgi:hypothetical protein
MNLSRKILAGALIALLPLGGAMACTTDAWDATSGSPLADDPDTSAANNAGETAAVKRYAGACGLRPAGAGNSFVTDNSPAGDGGASTPYRARFYVYTGLSAAAKVFSATDGENGAGTELVSVTYNPAGSFAIAGPGGASTSINGIVANRWYTVELKYQTGTTLDVFVRGAGTATEQTASTASVTGAGVQSVRLGVVGAPGGTGELSVDEFDSSRGASRIGSLLRGDAAGPSAGAPDNKCDANDASAMISEFFLVATGQPQFSLAPGQPDCTEDGVVDANDLSCLVTRFFAEVGNGQPCGGA